MVDLHTDSIDGFSANLVLIYKNTAWYLDKRLVAIHFKAIKSMLEVVVTDGVVKCDLSTYQPDWGSIERALFFEPASAEAVQTKEVLDVVIRHLYGESIGQEGDRGVHRIHLLEVCRFLDYENLTHELDLALQNTIPALPGERETGNTKSAVEAQGMENRLVKLAACAAIYSLPLLWNGLMVRNGTRLYAPHKLVEFHSQVVGLSVQVGRVGRRLHDNKVFDDSLLLEWYQSFFTQNCNHTVQ